MGNGLNFNLKNKNALVSGGTHGIGKAISIILAKSGCNVAVFSKSKEKVSAMNQILSNLGNNHVCMVCDVFDFKERQKVVNKINSQWGHIDILINNVGGGGRWGNECILDTDLSVWNEVMEKNLFSSIFFINALLRGMIDNNWGRVICITSIYGKDVGGRPWFNIAKASQNVLMKNLSQKKMYSSKNITFNSIAPGPIYIENTGWSELKNKKPDKFQEYIEKNIPRGVMGTAQEIANVVLFLCSDYSSIINGAIIPCDGGQGKCL